MIKELLPPTRVSQFDYLTIPSLFLAGGIDRAPDWQKEAIEVINNLTNPNKELLVFNPRRKEKFSKEDYDKHLEQVQWEFDHLRYAKAILFWFPENAPCTTSLFELGYWLGTGKNIYVGINPGHYKEKSINTQVKLLNESRAHPIINVYSTLDKMINDVLFFLMVR